MPTKVAGRGRLRVSGLLLRQLKSELGKQLSLPTYASRFTFMFFGKIILAASTEGRPSGTVGTCCHSSASQSLRPKRDCSATAPTAAKASSQSVAGNTACMPATRILSHCTVLMEPASDAALPRRHASCKADLNRQKRCVSHGCSSAVISAGAKSETATFGVRQNCWVYMAGSNI